MHAPAVPSNLDAAIPIYFAASYRKSARIDTRDNHVAIPMRSVTTASKISYNYARRSTPKAA